ncbi:allantoicase [Chitinimonas naiadis]
MTTFTAAPILAPAADLPDWARRAINLADPRIGAAALAASDAFFAPLERMLKPDPAAFIPGLYDDNGKWMDGWETRRKRTGGHDWSVIRLARRGVIQGFDVDTSHFTGNYAPAVSIEATDASSDELGSVVWTEILPAVSLKGNSHHLLAIDSQAAWTHLRIHIYPDGGIARLRVYGQALGVFEHLPPDAEVDLLALQNGGRAIAWNDAHYGQPANLLLPGRGINMGDGWETRRRREPGNDWCILALGTTGLVERIEVDTAHFKGNYPDRCSVQAALVKGGTDQSLITQSMFWPVLLPEQPLGMDAIHHFDSQLARLGPVSHVRFNIHPDGGVSRLRLWGKVAR